MKMTYKYFVLSFCAIFAFSACQKESSFNEVSNKKQEFVKITCTLPSDETKVTLTKEGDVGKVAWEVGDQILVHGQYVSPSTDPIYSYVAEVESISADKKTATFSIPAAIVKYGDRYGYAANLFAAYPASALKEYTGTETWYYHNVFENTNTFMLAGCNDNRSEESTYKIEFVNLSGAISFKVNGDFDQFIFRGNNDEVVGYDRFVARVDRKTTEGLYKVIPYTGGDLASIGGPTSGPKTSISVTTGFVHDGSKDNYVYFPNGANFTGGFKIQFLKSGAVVKEVSTSTAKNVAVGKYLALGDITSHLKDYVAPTSHNSAIDKTGATDLSATASANCYIVDGSDAGNINKIFKFKAYKGNSNTNVGTIASVEVLWETYNNADDVTANSVIAAVDYDKQAANDYYEIVFKMPTTLHAGNAVIAAKNAGGTILWSWHIWVPETTVSTNSYGDALGAVAMDRNLGALVAATAGSEAIPVKSLGFLYQWGRKDPFLGASSLTNGASAVSVNGTATSVSSGTISLEYSIANPTVFAYVADKDWINVSDDALWQNASKTIYDPCPPGYRVPVRNGDKAFWSSDLSSKTGWAENGTYGWFTLGNPAGVFPFAGYRDDSSPSSIAYAGTRALYWTSHRSGSVTSYGADVRFGSRHQLSSPARSRGGSIRCVVE